MRDEQFVQVMALRREVVSWTREIGRDFPFHPG